jgi:MFS transporter, SP family, sugar:H+ symporter
LQQLAIVLGIFLALLADWAIASAAGGSEREWLLGLEAWRWMFLSMTVASVLYGVLALTIPESPRHLVAKGYLDEAREVLRRVLWEHRPGRQGHPDQGHACARDPTGHAGPARPALGLLPIVWVGILLSVFQQFVGINVIFYYSSVLWQAVGFNEGDALLITVISSVVNVLTTLVAIATIDRFGRHPLLLIGSVGMAVTLGTLALISGTAPVVNGQPQLSGAAGPIALVAANLYVFAFGMSWGSGRVGDAGREVPQPDPGRRAGRGRGRAVDRQLVDLHQLPGAQRRRARPGLRHLYRLRHPVVFFVVRFVSETKGKELEEMRV